MTTSAVNVVVPNAIAPIRIGAYSEPYTVINQSTTATVWIGDDPAVGTSMGVKLAPLASCRRLGGVDTYAILDTANPTDQAPLMLSFTVDQYQDPFSVALALQNSGLILVDSPVAMIPATVLGPGTTVLPAANAVYDVRTAMSVYVNYVIDTFNAHTVLLRIAWYASINALITDLVGNDIFQWSSGDNAALFGRMLPVRGSFARVTVTIAGAGTQDTLAIQSSHRLWSPLAVNLNTRVIANGNTGVVGGANLVLTPGTRYDGPAKIVATGVPSAPAAGDGLEILVTDLVLGQVLYYGMQPNVALTGATRAAHYAAIVLPRNSWTATIANRSVSNTTITGEIVAAPEGT